jgi:fibronectin type 3 domain-containing protein
MKGIYYSIFLLSWICQQAFAQNQASAFTSTDTCSIYVLKNCKTDSIQLRWLINKPQAWEFIKNKGFNVERATFEPNSTSDPTFELLTTIPLKVLTEPEWKTLFKDKSKTAAMAQSLLFTPTSFNDANISGTEGIMERDRDLNMRTGFTMFVADQNFEVAKALGLGFTDRNVKENHSYLYKVYSAEKSEGFVIDTAYVLVEMSQKDLIPKMRTPIFEINDQKITLKWRSGERAGFTSYFIERALDGTESYSRLNDAPFVSMATSDKTTDWVVYSDSVPNYKKFKYRVIGITPFGESSEPSFPVTVNARDLTPPLPAIISKATEIEKQQMRIEWTLPAVSPDLKYLKVGRSTSNDGEYKLISPELNKTTLSYIDKEPIDFKGVYYKVFAYDTAGNYSQSLPFYGILVDSLPPAIPLGLSGFVDTNSVVHLKWELGKEPDLMGYRVYFANSPDHEFSVLTSQVHLDTVYHDTIQKVTLTKNIYYSIAAVDFNYNHSKKSPWIKIRRLDVIAPDAPIFKNVEVQDSSVFLAWHNSSSDDVAEHILYRKISGEKDFIALAKWKGYPPKTEYVDKQVVPKTFYEYAMVAIDSSNLKSDLSPLVSIRTFDRGIRPGVEALTISYDDKLKANVIKWNYTAQGKYSFLLYRGYQNFGITKYVKINSSDRSFIDRNLVGKGTYTYAIKAVYDDGGESPVTEKVNILIE